MRTGSSLSRSRVAPLGALSLVLVLVIAGCASDDDHGTQPPPPNQRPTARITAGASSGDSSGVDYRVDFEWAGLDPDGAVVGFEWAIDDTLTERAWSRTPAKGAHLNFTATTPVPGADSLFADWHAFYLRSVDDDSARSVPDSRYFNARTIAPVSRITKPDLSAQGPTPSLPRSFLVEWTGEDIDSPLPDKKPRYYEYKLVRLPEGTFPSPDSNVYRTYLYSGVNELTTLPGDARGRWIRVPEVVRSTTLRDLPPEESFVFGVRAVDEAGATEPKLIQNRNFIAFIVSSVVSQPDVIVSGERFGSHRFPSDGDVWNLQVPSGIDLGFRWTGWSPLGEPLESNYAIDIPDPDDEALGDSCGVGGWIGWGDWSGLVCPLRYAQEETGTTHVLWLRVREVGGERERRCPVRMTVVDFPMGKFALVVDDAKFLVGVPDAVHDAFTHDTFLRRLEAYGRVDHASVFTGSQEGGTPRIIPLSEMGLYRHILWSCEPASTRSGLDGGLTGGRDNNNQNLQSYLSAGGRLFLFGGRVAGMERADFHYPIEPPRGPSDPAVRTIYYRFLHLHDGIVSSGCRDHPICDRCYSRTSGLFAVRSMHPAFPDLTLDASKWDPYAMGESDYRGGIGSWEGSMHLGEGEPEAIAGLDSLYAAETWDRSVLPECAVRSPVHGAICAVRYESTHQDTLENRAHGRTIAFLFQPYWFLRDQVQSAGTAAIEWLVTGRE